MIGIINCCNCNCKQMWDQWEKVLCRFYVACIAGVSGEGRGVGKTEWGEGNGAFSPQPPFSSPLPFPLHLLHRLRYT